MEGGGWQEEVCESHRDIKTSKSVAKYWEKIEAGSMLHDSNWEIIQKIL